MSESFAELFESNKGNLKAEQGSLIEGKIAQITASTVVVDAGLKSEGIISVEEFLDKNNELQFDVGDTVEVVLDTLEDGFGKTRMSRIRARQLRIWSRLEEAHEKNLTMKGILVGKVKGGFTVDIDGVTAFLPGSLTDVKPMRDANYSYLENKEVEFKVIKLDHRRNNIVVSRKAVLEDQYGADHEEMAKSLKEGTVTKGIVKHLTDYGAFVEFNGFDGLLHITDMAWKRINHPSELLSVGDDVEVKILKYDKEKNRISLGLKQMTEDPWIQLVASYPEGTRTFGKVINLTDYGCFVELEEGIEGLVHVSEMDWTNRNVVPSKLVSVGDKVEVMVISVDKSKRRISLGFKQCMPNPWQEFAQQYPKGSKFKGVVKSINDFGLFVGLADGRIDGLVHINDISSTEPGDQAILKYKKGDEVEVVVMSTDVERERISFSIKALHGDPLKDYLNLHPKNSVVKGTVAEIGERYVFVQLDERVRGAVFCSDFTTEDGKAGVEKGDEVEAKLLGIDRKNCLIKLSVKEKEKEERAQAVETYSAKKEPATTKLGEIFGRLINPFKKK